MRREIVELDDFLLEEAQALADEQGKSLSDVVGAAVRAYVSATVMPRRLSFTGLGASSGPPITLEQQDDIIRRGLDPVEGWSPDRSDDVPSEPVAGDSGPPPLSLIGLIDVPATWTQEELDQELMDGLDPLRRVVARHANCWQVGDCRRGEVPPQSGRVAALG